MSTKPSHLYAQDLVAGYTSRPDIRGVNLEVYKGAPAQGITGASGVGKTTLANALVGALKPVGGRVTFNGKAVSRLRLGEKKRYEATVRKVAQNGFFGYDTALTVRRVVEDELRAARKTGRGSGKSIEEVLDLMFLEDRFIDRKLHTMSGGERQRLSIALALTTAPDVLVLDEPTTALDATLKDKVSARLRDIVAEREIGLVVFSHDLNLLSRLTPTVHVLSDGVFVESGSPRDLLTDPHHQATRDIAEAYPEAVRALRSLED
ncbi:ABC transporter ATP-binding protein [Timonella senegalensis]|uniref:ABC transporter ATP-binding protein n=1 Tax=Timonella senegalensis TaxID=1465825 RepID=UPI0028B26383|nr:ATP-binding cassette domain-containing protein [Timonella senegalensis]